MPIELTIETRDLRKHYGQNEVLAGLTLKVQKGSICGFLGRNGAGKTTTLKLLMGLCRPTAGEGLVFGLKIDRADESSRIRQKTGFVSEEKLFPGSVTVRELLNFTRAFYPRWRSDLEKRYLREFELPLSASAAKLSKGMLSKLALLLVPPRCRAIVARRTDRGFGSRDQGRSTAGPGLACRRARHDHFLFDCAWPSGGIFEEDGRLRPSSFI